MQESVELSVDFNTSRLCDGLFARRIVEENRLELVTLLEWNSDRETFLEQLTSFDAVEVVVTTKTPNYEAAVFYLRSSLVLADLTSKQMVIRVAGPAEEVRFVADALESLVPRADETARVKVNFWYWSAPKAWARRITRLLEVPGWAEIAINYPPRTRHAVEALVASGMDARSGQLILWFGDPGTGKTYALRALLMAWKERFKLHYISDPENFFGNSDYMLSVLLEEGDDRPKLLILEDSGEFLLPDARQQMGQGLSRLLNASDGLIGQGLRSTFLITTNEPMNKLHPAVSRPGRCAAQIEFGEFTQEEAEEWLQRAGAPTQAAPRGTRLADLFAMTRGEPVRGRNAKIGF